MSLGLTTLGWGIMVDWLGPRVILPLSAVFFGAGCLLFAFSRPQGACSCSPSNSDFAVVISNNCGRLTPTLCHTGFDAYAIGFVGIAAGGCGMFYGLVRLRYVIAHTWTI
jgi:hypothetical protein